MATNIPDSSNTGKVIIDGTAYSGADIKVIAHVYNSKQKEQLKDLQSQILGASTQAQVVKAQANLQEAISSGSLFQTKILAEVQTLSVSTYREKYPVRAIGSSFVRGYTRGPRTIAGSIVFTVFDKNVLYEILSTDTSDFDVGRNGTSLLLDQLPPVDITIAFANELGQQSLMTIYGVEFMQEGQVMSIHDLFIENTVQYVARDIEPMRNVNDNRYKVLASTGTVLASDLAGTKPAQDYVNSLDPFTGFLLKGNPFK